ncbi:hypothetical protein [Spirosoma aerophilum]
MSVSSNSRKESTESYAAQGMHNTMGILPELAQLNDKNLDNELPSRVADSNDTNVPEDVLDTEATAAESDNAKGASVEDIEESKRASWGQPPVSDDDLEANKDWKSNTSEETIPATRANEPDRTLGIS